MLPPASADDKIVTGLTSAKTAKMISLVQELLTARGGSCRLSKLIQNIIDKDKLLKQAIFRGGCKRWFNSRHEFRLGKDDQVSLVGFVANKKAAGPFPSATPSCTFGGSVIL